MAFVVWILWRLATRYDKSGWWTFGWFLVLSGIERFLVEFVRINPIWFWRLTQPQWVSIVSVAHRRHAHRRVRQEAGGGRRRGRAAEPRGDEAGGPGLVAAPRQAPPPGSGSNLEPMQASVREAPGLARDRCRLAADLTDVDALTVPLGLVLRSRSPVVAALSISSLALRRSAQGGSAGIQSGAVSATGRDAAMISRVREAFSRHGYILAVGAIALSTALFLPGRDSFAKGQWALLYLLVILLVASAAGTGPAVLAAVLAFLAWNFFFLPPYHTFAIRDPKDWLSLVAFLVVGVIVGIQAGRMREREARALAREKESRGPEQAERRGRLADLDRADGRELSERGGRSPRRGVGDPVLPRGRRAAVVLPGAGRQLHGRRRRRACSPCRRGGGVGRRAGGREVDGWPRRATAGSTCPSAARPASSGVLTVQARRDGRRVPRGRRPARHVAQQPRRCVPRA